MSSQIQYSRLTDPIHVQDLVLVLIPDLGLGAWEGRLGRVCLSIFRTRI